MLLIILHFHLILQYYKFKHKIYKIKLIKIHLNIFTHIPFKKNGRGGKY